MSAVVVWLTAAVLAVALLTALGKVVVWSTRKLNEIESHTKQLTTNGGAHLADVVRRTEVKVDGMDEKWVAQQGVVKDALEAQQEVVKEALEGQQANVHGALVAQQANVREALEAQQANVKDTLEAQQEVVHDALEGQQQQLDSELKEVWKTLATRDIHRASDQLLDAADRAEKAQPKEHQ